MIKAGTELTWQCSPGQEVVCQCGNEDCQGVPSTELAVCEVCDVHENGHENGHNNSQNEEV